MDAQYISRVNLNGKDLVVALDPTFSDFWCAPQFTFLSRVVAF